MKTCSKCGKEKPLDCFGRNTRALDGLQFWCKECRRAYSKTWNASNAGSSAERKRKNRYGLTPEMFRQMLIEQENACAICRREIGAPKTVQVDHDHSCCAGKTSCGKCVRGLLCFHCNSGLGHFQDSVDTLTGAVEYLGRANAIQ